MSSRSDFPLELKAQKPFPRDGTDPRGCGSGVRGEGWRGKVGFLRGALAGAAASQRAAWLQAESGTAPDLAGERYGVDASKRRAFKML